MSRYVGVDGCPGGWFAVAREDGRVVDADCHESFDAVLAAHDADRVLVDIPIGLPEGGRRACDTAARDRLGARASTVFFAPCRAVLAADDHAMASARNREHTGCGLSIQAWNLVPRIRDVDALLRTSQRARALVSEAHPELCFAALGEGPVEQSKSTDAGRTARLDRLRPFVPDVDEVYERCLEEFRRTDVARDDVLDALVLAVAAAGPLSRLPDVPDDAVPRDGAGLPMEIRYPDFEHLDSNPTI